MPDQPDDGVAQVHVQWDPSYLPPLFYGKPEEDFLTWIRKLELAVQTYPHGAPPLPQLLGNRLDGKAFTYWEQLPQATKNNFENAKARLAEVYGKTAQLRKVRDYAYSRPRQVGESLDTYAADLRKLVDSAFSGDYDYGENFKDREVLRQFVRGLSPSLRKKCMEQGPQNIDAALTLAKRLEFASKFEESQQSAVDQSITQTSVQAIHSSSDISELTKMMSGLCNEMKSIKETNLELQDQMKSLKGKTKYPYSERDEFFNDSEVERRGRDRYRQSPNRSRYRSYSPFHSRRYSSSSPSSSGYYSEKPDSFGFRSNSYRSKSPMRDSDFYRPPEYYRSSNRHDSPNSRHFTYSDRHERYRSPSPLQKKRVSFSPSPTRRYYESNSGRNYQASHDRQKSGNLNDRRSMMRVNYRPDWRK